MPSDAVKFLLVDDQDDNLACLEDALARDGLELVKARTGPLALELVEKHDFALALLDVQMPGMSGFELAERMRSGAARARHVPIIFLTGDHDAKVMFRGYDKGAVDFLYKPVDDAILRSKADVFFELYRQRRELEKALELNELFMRALGHDLRNPLSALSTGIQVLKMQLDGKPQQKSLDRMQQAAGKMNDMLKELGRTR